MNPEFRSIFLAVLIGGVLLFGAILINNFRPSPDYSRKYLYITPRRSESAVYPARYAKNKPDEVLCRCETKRHSVICKDFFPGL